MRSTATWRASSERPDAARGDRGRVRDRHAAARADAVDWVRANVTLRAGFHELAERHRPVIVSGGFRELIEPVLAREGVELEVLANSLDARAGRLAADLWRDEAICATCGEPCKRGVLAGEPVRLRRRRVLRPLRRARRRARLRARRARRLVPRRGVAVRGLRRPARRPRASADAVDRRGCARGSRRPPVGIRGVASFATFTPGAADLETRAALLADRLSDGLKPLARVAYNYAWSWLPDGEAVFRDINRHRWGLSGGNPVQFLGDLWPRTQERAEQNPELLERIQALAGRDIGVSRAARRRLAGHRRPSRRSSAPSSASTSRCRSTRAVSACSPATSSRRRATRRCRWSGSGFSTAAATSGSDSTWRGASTSTGCAIDPKSLPMARVTNEDGSPLRLDGDALRRALAFQVWRVDVGRVPLLLLDTEIPANDEIQRWTTARLYEGNRAIRLAQYGLLGIGGARVLEALGIEPAVIHLNEGHPALAPLELSAARVAAGTPFEEALAEVRERVVFTTHTPVPAGNETYRREEFLGAFGDLPGRLGIDEESLARALPRRSGRCVGASRHDGPRVARELAPQRRQPPAR